MKNIDILPCVYCENNKKRLESDICKECLKEFFKEFLKNNVLFPKFKADTKSFEEHNGNFVKGN